MQFIHRFVIVTLSHFVLSSSSLQSADLEFIEISDESTARLVFPLFSKLNTHINEESFLTNFNSARKSEYHLYQVNDQESNQIGLLGFQFVNSLYVGRSMRVDTLIIASNSRRLKYGQKVANFAAQAFYDDYKRNNCKFLFFQTGENRRDAVSFYEAILGQKAIDQSYHYRIDCQTFADPKMIDKFEVNLHD